MGLFDIFSGWGKQRRRTNDAAVLAQGMVRRYHQRRERGEWRFDENLYLELTQVMPEKAAQEVYGHFRQRRAHEHPKAEGLLIGEIIAAVLDADHFSSTAKPIHRPSEEERLSAQQLRGMTAKQRVYAKALAGQALTDEEEDAMLWG